MSSELKGLVDRLNPLCHQALQAAAERAVAHGRQEIAPQHLVAEILRSGDTDLRALLVNHGVDPGGARDELDAAATGEIGGRGGIPAFTSALSMLLQKAWLVSSTEHQRTRIRSGPFLVALLRETGAADAVAHAAPSMAGLDASAVSADLPEVMRHTTEGEGEPRAGADAQASTDRAWGQAEASASVASGDASVFTEDLTARARAGQIDPVIGRESEVAQTIDILMRRRQNNPVLLGQPGVGKTAIAEGLARRVAAGDVPQALRGTRVLILDLAQLQAGTGVRGEFEKRIKGLLQALAETPVPTVLFVDEVHTLIGAGGAEGQGDAANLLKPALARGDVRMIGATTWPEYKLYIEKDPALARRFQAVRVDEPDAEAALAMVRGVAGTLEAHHDVRIEDHAIRAAVDLSTRYIPARYLPDKAISVLDTACARVALAQGASPNAVHARKRDLEIARTRRDRLQRDARLVPGEPAVEGDKLDAEVTGLEARAQRTEDQAQAERALVQRIRDIEKLAEHRDLEPDERARLHQLYDDLQAAQHEVGLCPTHVDKASIAAVIAAWTGVPVDRQLQGSREAAEALFNELRERVVGQAAAADAIARRLQVAAAGLSDPAKPMGTFLLAGPTGVGKTETAHVVAEVMFGGSDRMVTVNMSEYQEAHSVAGLKGAPPGYVGYGSGGVLTEAVRRTPYNVVLLDEFEKAHPDVRELFYQVFDTGMLEDSEGQRVDFTNTIILATSNVGADVIAEAAQQGHDREAGDVSGLQRVLSEVFPAALLGRMNVIPYWPLGRDEFDRIARHRLQRVAAQYQDVYGAGLTISDAAVSWIVESADGVGHSGARAVHRVIDEDVVPRIARQVLIDGGGQQGGGDVSLGLGEDARLVIRPCQSSPRGL